MAFIVVVEIFSRARTAVGIVRPVGWVMAIPVSWHPRIHVTIRESVIHRPNVSIYRRYLRALARRACLVMVLVPRVVILIP